MKQLNGNKQMKDVWKLPAMRPGKSLVANTRHKNRFRY